MHNDPQLQVEGKVRHSFEEVGQGLGTRSLPQRGSFRVSSTPLVDGHYGKALPIVCEPLPRGNARHRPNTYSGVDMPVYRTYLETRSM